MAVSFGEVLDPYFRRDESGSDSNRLLRYVESAYLTLLLLSATGDFYRTVLNTKRECGTRFGLVCKSGDQSVQESDVP